MSIGKSNNLVNTLDIFTIYILKLISISLIFHLIIILIKFSDDIFRVVLIFGFYTPILSLIIQEICLTVWVIKRDKNIVGIIKAFSLKNSILISSFGVLEKYRNQGIGSALISHVINQYSNSKSIFLDCKPNLISYYSHFGFQVLSNNFIFAINTLLIKMVKYNYQNKNNLKFTSINNYRSYISQKYDVDKITCFLRTYPQLEYFVSFSNGNYLLYKFTVFFGCILGFISLNNLTLLLGSFVYFDEQIILIEWTSILMVLSLIFIFSWRIIKLAFNIVKSREWNNFWLFECNDQLIGYARFSHYKHYSILRCLGLVVEKKDLKLNLLQQFLSQQDKTIYFGCESHETEFYKSLGFTNIRINDLPQKLRMGGRINILCGGSNLVYLR